jgi:hypothetical protein
MITTFQKYYSRDLGTYIFLSEGSELESRLGQYYFLLHKVEIGTTAYPVSYPVGTEGSFPVGKVAGPEADHSPPSSVEVKNGTDITLFYSVQTGTGAHPASCLMCKGDFFPRGKVAGREAWILTSN